ncbi:unnamed protein product [Acanthosepion pharaonis]|uniref:Uncharacterized protein n=1 Tax=Acanthosepion pharaonis TaxID=158019 RepID=A0A812CXQ0_ACAPH|nr:unnamed protein product [Sepia pharaonis]
MAAFAAPQALASSQHGRDEWPITESKQKSDKCYFIYTFCRQRAVAADIAAFPKSLSIFLSPYTSLSFLFFFSLSLTFSLFLFLFLSLPLSFLFLSFTLSLFYSFSLFLFHSIFPSLSLSPFLSPSLSFSFSLSLSLFIFLFFLTFLHHSFNLFLTPQ